MLLVCSLSDPKAKMTEIMQNFVIITLYTTLLLYMGHVGNGVRKLLADSLHAYSTQRPKMRALYV